jgi:transcriptional regulator of acetoin/glycerol metabolism
VPALRDRFEDIPDLVTKAAANVTGPDRRRWTPEALRAMCDYRWPGNLRQLDGVVRSVAATGPRGEVTLADLPADVRAASHPSRFSGMQQMERTTIVDALRAAGGSKTEAARALGIGRATLYRKIKGFAIDA